jgi:hypothetical protein
MTSIERSVFPTLEVDRVKTGGLMRPFLEERQACGQLRTKENDMSISRFSNVQRYVLLPRIVSCSAPGPNSYRLN